MKIKKKNVIIFLLVFIFGGFLFYTATNAENEFIDESKIRNCKEESKKFCYNAFSVAKKIDKKDVSCTSRLGNEGSKNTVFLTFDDGPSINNTPKVLEILDKYEVKATFFVITEQLEQEEQKKILKNTYEKGHAIANHTHTHDFSKLFPKRNANLDRFSEEIKKSESELKNVLGENFSTKVVRVPGGSMSWNGINKIKDWASKNDIALVDWSISGGDADRVRKTSDKIFQNATGQGNSGTVVLLLHDAATKSETVKALPRIIEYYKNKGYTFGILS